MFFAIDKNNIKTYIDNINNDEDYYCEICHSKLIKKNNGLIRHHHFAHPKGKCLDTWTPDNSEWHMDWQKKFPLEYLEIVKTDGNRVHRADILIEDIKTVVELQHSPISASEFNDRNNFYNSLGYKVIWLFDLTKQYYNGSIYQIEELMFEWSRPKQTFRDFGYNFYPNVKLYFQFKIDIKNKEYLDYIISNSNIEEKRFYERHKNDVTEIVRVEWNNRPNFNSFIVSYHVFSEQDFIDEVLSGSFKEYKKPKIKNITNNPVHKLEPQRVEKVYGEEELYNELKFAFEDNEKYIFDGCPLSVNHRSAIWKEGFKPKDMLTIKNCMLCPFSGLRQGKIVCRRKFAALIKHMDKNDKIIDIKRDELGRIIQVTILSGISKKIFEYEY